MNIIRLTLLFFIISIGTSFSQEDINIQVVRTEEQARLVAPLYVQYNQVNRWTEERFLEGWRNIHQHSNYCMLAAYDKEYGVDPVGLIDATVFPSLFHEALMRIDSIYIISKETNREKIIFAELWNKIEAFAKEKGVTEIHTNSGSAYDQERRLFAYTMDLVNPEKSSFYRKKLER